MEKAVFAGGCFWCTEAIFKRLKGVTSVLSGYSGGTNPNPDYWQSHDENTGEAESIQIEFDPKILPYEKLVEIFFHTHDPTSVNRQGYDTGPDYRSIIFYFDEKQKNEALKVKKEVDDSGYYNSPIVTEIKPFEKFYPAEEYHRDYYERSKRNLYCRFVIDPKLKKLLEMYKEEVKEEYKE